MNADALELLQYDHDALRRKLALLESALRFSPHTWYVLREACFLLSRRLHEHMEREAKLADWFADDPIVAGALGPMLCAHQPDFRRLRDVNQQLIQEPEQLPEALEPSLAALIESMRRHLDEQERRLFPAAVARQEAAEFATCEATEVGNV